MKKYFSVSQKKRGTFLFITIPIFSLQKEIVIEFSDFTCWEVYKSKTSSEEIHPSTTEETEKDDKDSTSSNDNKEEDDDEEEDKDKEKNKDEKRKE